jgi:chaperonin cofactor prefoldin
MRRVSTSFLVACIFLVIVIVGFLVFYLQTSTRISNNTDAISTLQSALVSVESDISSLEGQLASAKSQITSLQSQTSSDSSKISSLQTQLASANSQISSLQTEITSLKNQVSSDSSRISSLQSELASLNSLVTSLQSQVTTLQYYLSSSTTPTLIGSSLTITQSYGQQSLVTSFTASGVGYLVINGYSTSSTGYVYTINSTYGTSSVYAFSTTTTTVNIPVQAGSIYIYFGNSDTSGTVTAVFSSIYYYHY